MHAIIRLLVKCRQCGKCCIEPKRYVPNTEAASIAALTKERFYDVQQKLSSYPCGYLLDNKCMIHEIKPSCCRFWPGVDADCPAYKELAEKCYVPGALSKICNDNELSKLYAEVLIKGDKKAAYEILKRLGVKL